MPVQCSATGTGKRGIILSKKKKFGLRIIPIDVIDCPFDSAHVTFQVNNMSKVKVCQAKSNTDHTRDMTIQTFCNKTHGVKKHQVSIHVSLQGLTWVKSFCRY